MLQVAVIEVVEVRVRADQAGGRDRADNEQGRGGAVVGLLAGILAHSAAELAESQRATRSAWPPPARSVWNAATESDSSFKSAACAPNWLAYVSKPSSEM
jgi:hypothetical protein